MLFEYKRGDSLLKLVCIELCMCRLYRLFTRQHKDIQIYPNTCTRMSCFDGIYKVDKYSCLNCKLKLHSFAVFFFRFITFIKLRVLCLRFVNLKKEKTTLKCKVLNKKIYYKINFKLELYCYLY